MDPNTFFFQALVYLAAAVVFVPVAKRLGLGSVLGYLIAGIIIGPFVLGFIGKEGEDIINTLQLTLMACLSDFEIAIAMEEYEAIPVNQLVKA